MKVINLFAGPGVGKSTTAAGLFYEMKKSGYSVELVTEYAKDMTWERRYNVLGDQLYVLAKQQRRVDRLKDHNIDFVVNDGPSIQGIVYYTGQNHDLFCQLAVQNFNSNDNLNYYLNREFDYDPIGRNQNLDEAIEKDNEISAMLKEYGVGHTKVDVSKAIPLIMKDLMS